MRRLARASGLVVLSVFVPVTVAVLLVVCVPSAEAVVRGTAPKDLPTVINNITKWLVEMLVSLATLFLTIGFLRLLLAGGDPGEVAKGKEALKNAAIGFGGALLAPVLVKILQSFVGG